MPLPQFVNRRGQQLWYRRAFPKELWPVTKNTYFAISLRTADPREAMRARPEAERRYQDRVDDARAELARRSSMPPLTKAGAETLAVQWFLQALESAEDFRSATMPDAIERRIEDAEWGATEARRALAEGDLRDAERTARCLREAAGFAPEPVAEAALARLLKRAAVALHEVEAGRLLAQYGTRPSDPLFASAMDAPSAAPQPPQGAHREATAANTGPTVADLVEAYRTRKLPALGPAAQLGYGPVFRLLSDVTGANKPLASLTHDDGQQLFDAVQGLPINAQKLRALRGLPVPEAIAEGRRLGLPTLAAKTVNDRYMANLGALFRFASARGWMTANPVAGLRAREEVAAADKREPFGARLPALFRSAPWTPRDATGGGKPIKYWGPLLALFHGLRLGEVAGLQVADIGEEQGTPMIYIRAGARGLKSASARRDLPVHPELVRLGFVEFAAERQSAARPEEMLFEGERAFARNQWGRRLGEWFTAEVRARGMQGRKLGFHSLRHDFRDALREAEVEAPLADYLMGHAQQGMGALYGARRPSVARLRGAVEAVRYPGLILPGSNG